MSLWRNIAADVYAVEGPWGLLFWFCKQLVWEWWHQRMHKKEAALNAAWRDETRDYRKKLQVHMSEVDRKLDTIIEQNGNLAFGLTADIRFNKESKQYFTQVMQEGGPITDQLCGLNRTETKELCMDFTKYVSEDKVKELALSEIDRQLEEKRHELEAHKTAFEQEIAGLESEISNLENDRVELVPVPVVEEVVAEG